MKEDHVILGVHITDRTNNAPKVQDVLTEYGCSIKTRLGLHETSQDFCSPEGVVILEILANAETCEDIVTKLSAIDGIQAQKMIFSHV